MEIPYIPDYSSLRFSGCCQKHENTFGVKRTYALVDKYDRAFIEITSIFGFVWKIDNTYFTNYPITHSFQHLLININSDQDYYIDYESFISLN